MFERLRWRRRRLARAARATCGICVMRSSSCPDRVLRCLAASERLVNFFDPVSVAHVSADCCSPAVSERHAWYLSMRDLLHSPSSPTRICQCYREWMIPSRHGAAQVKRMIYGSVTPVPGASTSRGRLAVRPPTLPGVALYCGITRGGRADRARAEIARIAVVTGRSACVGTPNDEHLQDRAYVLPSADENCRTAAILMVA